MKPIPLFGTGIRSYSEVVTRQRRLNCFYDIREDQDKSSIVLVGTPGTRVWITLPTAPVWGTWVVDSVLYVVAGTTLYSVTQGGLYTSLGAVPTVAREVAMADNAAQLIIVDGIAGYIYTIATGVLSVITDSNFPNGTTSVTYLNSKFYVNEPRSRSFRVSQTLDGSLWTPLVFGTKENGSDLLLEVYVVNSTLVLAGTATTEFWQDVGSAPLAVQRVNGSTQSWGLAAKQGHQLVGNTAMFLGVNADGGIQVCKLSGYTVVPVSTSDIDALLMSFDDVSDADTLVYSAYGHSLFQITFPSANRTLLYDFKTNMWQEAQTGADEVGRHLACEGFRFNRKSYCVDDTTGNIYQFDINTYTDAGEAIPREVCTRHIRAAGNEVFLNQLVLEMETGVGLSGQADPQITLSLSRDGGKTFGPEKAKSIGAQGVYGGRLAFNRLGSGRDIVARIRMTDPVKFILCSGSAEIESVNG